jgi:hypothetical protein
VGLAPIIHMELLGSDGFHFYGALATAVWINQWKEHLSLNNFTVYNANVRSGSSVCTYVVARRPEAAGPGHP